MQPCSMRKTRFTSPDAQSIAFVVFLVVVVVLLSPERYLSASIDVVQLRCTARIDLNRVTKNGRSQNHSHTHSARIFLQLKKDHFLAPRKTTLKRRRSKTYSSCVLCHGIVIIVLCCFLWSRCVDEMDRHSLS